MGRVRKTDLLLLAFDNYVWGTSWSAIKYSERQMNPIVLNLWALGISVLVLLPFAYAEYRRGGATRRRITRHDLADYAIMGFLGVTAMTVLYNLGAERSTAANGALITTMVPVLTALIAVAVLRERLTKARIAGLVIALVGVLILSGVDLAGVKLGGSYLAGNLLLLAGVVGNAVYVVFGKKLLESSGWVTVLFWGQLLGFIGSLPFLAIEPFHLKTVGSYTVYTWLSLIFLGAIFYAMTMLIFFKILGRFDAGQIMIFAYLQPIFGVIMAAVLLHERITAIMIIGGLLVIGGALVVSLEKSPEPVPVREGQH